MAKDTHTEDLSYFSEESGEPLDVLDLPQLYQHPSVSTLLLALDDLTSTPPSWTSTPKSSASPPKRKRRKVRSDRLPSYLTQIIASPLAWIERDDEKERIWEAAAIRLSERSGRTGMGNLVRTFPIPLDVVDIDSEMAESALDSADAVTSAINGETVEIMLYEPALTSDNLGLKTWASAYLLAKRLPCFRETLPELAPGAQILELGAGTGLVGLAAACVFRTRVLLTDLPAMVTNLEKNVRANAAALTENHASAECAVLDWSAPSTLQLPDGTPLTEHSFSLILVADPIYDHRHPALLVSAISYHLSKDEDARVVIELPLRDCSVPERNELWERLGDIGMVIRSEGEEVGFDDFVAAGGPNEDEELAEVRCWWGVWGWG